MDYVLIGAEIRRRRKKRGCSQERIGEMVGLSQKQVSKIETHGSDSLWKVARLADVFEISVEELINPSSQGKEMERIIEWRDDGD